MKTAKKVLAIVLAAMLLIGTIPFAASAYDFTDDQKIYFRLNAEVFDAEGAEEVADIGLEAEPGTAPTTTQKANQLKDFAEYNGVAFSEHVYADKTKTIYVQPGQIVWVTFGFKSTGDLYPTTIESIINYTNLFLSVTNNSSTKNKKTLVENDESDYISLLGGGGSLAYWALMNQKTRNKYIASNGDHSYYATYDVGYEEVLANVDDDIFAVPFYVNPNAEDGDEGSIYMTEDLANYYNYIQGFDGDYSQSAEPFEIAGEQLDYTGAVLNFKVGDEPAGLDYTELDKAIDKFEDLTEEDWTADTWADAADAYDAAVAIKDDVTATQDDVDDATDALNAAIDALEEPAALDFTPLDDAFALIPADVSNCTTSSVAALDTATDAALAAYDATTQDEINTAAGDLLAAIDALEDKADMKAIEDAIAYANGLDKSDMSDESIDELNDAVAAAQAILAQADDFSDQAAVADAAQAIYDVRIMYEVANYTEVWDLMDEAALKNEADYTTASWADLQTALGAVVPGLGKSQQATVDGFAAAISEALDGLKEKIDTAGLAAAVSIADGENKEDYTTQDWMQLQVYVNTAKNDYIGKEADYASDDKQGEVDQLANDIYDILAKKLGDADYSAVEAALAKIPEDDILAGVYTDESVAVLDEIAESLVWGLKEDKQDQVDKMAQDLEDAIAGLTPKKADYDMVDKYLAQAAGIDRDLYTAASLDVLDAAVAAVVRDLDITHQDEVTGMANDLYAALEGLEMLGADFTAIDEIAENAGDLAREFYTDDSLAAYDAAVADALAIYANKADYTIADQAVIDAAAAKGADAASLLVAKDADFTAIDAIAAADEALVRENYTDDSLAAYDAAVANALAIYANKADFDIFDQDMIDDTAAEGEAAFDLLEEKPVDPVEPEGMVKSVEYEESVSTLKTYAVKVDGRAFKIQFVDANGNTVTFSRVDNRDKIVSYNEEGAVVEDLARDLAYEIWTVPVNLKDGDYKVIARNEVTGWETLDLGYDLKVASSVKYATADEISVDAESCELYAQLPVTVKTGKDVLKVSILVNGATYMTFDKSYATAEGDQLIFNVYVKLYTKGANTITAKIKTVNGWEDTDLSATVEGVKTAAVVY